MKLGHEVNIVTAFWNGGDAYEEFEGLNIYRVKDSSYYLGKLGRLFSMHYFTFGWNILKYIKVIRDSDIVHTYPPLSSSGYLIKNSIPYINHFYHRALPSSIKDILTIPILFLLEKYSYKNASAIITSSRSSKDVLINEYHIEPDKIYVIPNGVANEFFEPCPERKNEDNVTRLLFVGQLVQRKGIEYLIQAMPEVLKHTRATLTIIGSGELDNRLNEMVKSLGLEENIIFIPYSENIKNQYCNHDILIQPSLQEGFGMVVAEAMASGLPVVVSDIPTLREVSGDTGILAMQRDSMALADAILTLIQNDAFRRESGKKARHRAEKMFRWDDIACKSIEVYKEVIGKKVMR